MSKLLKIVCYAAVSLAMSSASAHATAIADGSFEIKGGALPVNSYCYDGLPNGDGPCAASVWVGNGVIHSGEGAWGGTVAPDGNYYGFVQGVSSLSQSFLATGTTAYVLSWLDAGRNALAPQTYGVSVSDGVTTQNLGIFGTAVGQPFGARTSSVFSLTAGTTYTLTFQGLVAPGTDATSFIDKVVIAPVPEPATWVMMIAGLGVGGLLLRRRRQQGLGAVAA